MDSKKTNRVVSISDVISTLYKYYKESLCVTIKLGDSDEATYKFDLKLSKSDLKKLDLKQAPSSEKEAEYIIEEFINNKLKDYADREFLEEFVEVPISGIYEASDDDSEITLSSGGKKVFITYRLNND